jgi:hypothetical protein
MAASPLVDPKSIRPARGAGNHAKLTAEAQREAIQNDRIHTIITIYTIRSEGKTDSIHDSRQYEPPRRQEKELTAEAPREAIQQ